MHTLPGQGKLILPLPWRAIEEPPLLKGGGFRFDKGPSPSRVVFDQNLPKYPLLPRYYFFQPN